MSEGHALVVDDGDLLTGRILQRVLERAGWEADLVVGSVGFDAARARPPALLVVRHRTVTHSMDARPLIIAAQAAAGRAGTPRPVVVVFANFGGSAMSPGDDDVADLVIDVPADLVRLEARFRSLRGRVRAGGEAGASSL